MKRLITLILLSFSFLARAQLVPIQPVTIPDANILDTLSRPIPGGLIFTKRTYGTNETRFYYMVSGTATGGTMGMNADTLALNKKAHYIIQRDSGLTSAYFYTTIKILQPVANIPDYYSKLQAYLLAQDFISRTQMDATYVSIGRFNTEVSLRKADSTLIRGKLDTAYISTAKTLYYGKSNPQKFIPRDSILAVNGATFNKTTLTIGTDGTLQTATQVNNAITTALSAGGYASATSVSNERTRAQTAENNLSNRIMTDSTQRVSAVNNLQTQITANTNSIANMPPYTASLGVIKTGNNFTSDTTYNRSVANSFTKAQVNSAIATAIAGIPVYGVGYGILKTGNTFSADTAGATGIVSKARLATNLNGYYKASNPNGYISSVTFPVTSVFGRTGAILATAADYAAYYKPITYTPSSSEITAALGYTPYNGTTNPNGYISTFTETDPLYTANGVPKTRTINGQALSANLTLTTDNVSEGTTNLYYTNTRARAAISALPNGGIAYDATGGTIAQVTPTTSLTTRAFNTAYTISATRPARVYYTIRISYSITVLLGSTGVVQLQYSTDGGTTYKIGPSVSNNLNLGIALSGYNDFVLAGEVPAGALVKLVSTATNATNAVTSVEEVIY